MRTYGGGGGGMFTFGSCCVGKAPSTFHHRRIHTPTHPHIRTSTLTYTSTSPSPNMRTYGGGVRGHVHVGFVLWDVDHTGGLDSTWKQFINKVPPGLHMLEKGRLNVLLSTLGNGSGAVDTKTNVWWLLLPNNWRKCAEGETRKCHVARQGISKPRRNARFQKKGPI